MSRFTLSGNAFYSSLGYERPSTTAKTQRIRIASTGESFLPNNTITSFRPQTSRSTSSAFRNTKNRLEHFQEKMGMMLEDVKQTRVTAKEALLRVSIAKEELNQRGIQQIKQALTQDIKALEKSIQIKKRSDMLKFQALHETCRALHLNTKSIKGKLNEVSDRLYQIQNLLGYHGLRDKLRY